MSVRLLCNHDNIPYIVRNKKYSYTKPLGYIISILWIRPHAPVNWKGKGTRHKISGEGGVRRVTVYLHTFSVPSLKYCADAPASGLEDKIGTRWEGEQYLLGVTRKSRNADCSGAGSPELF